MSKDKFYITTPIYYVNDKPHVGSAYTTIAADVLARFYRARAVDTFFLTGTAEHGSKIAQSAERAGKEVKIFVDEMSAKFSLAWDILEISNDDFIRTTEPRHEEAVRQFFLKLKESGKLYEGEYEGLYCVGHEAFIKESELINGLCPEHKTKPEQVKEKNWFFKLSEYGEVLKKKIQSGELAIAPEERKNEVLAFIDQGLEDITISRQNAKFALPLPWDKNQTIYVWLDELFNYCSAIGYGSDSSKFKKYWPADVHLVGKDIIKFHCVIWPALLLAIGESIPRKVFAHGFFTVDGQKISKTVGNVIDPVELAEKYGSDAVRYFLLREIAFGQDGDVSEEKLKARYEGELANGLGNLVSRILGLLVMHTEYDKDLKRVKVVFDFGQIDALIENFKFHEALAKIWEAVGWANKRIDETKLWDLFRSNKEQALVVAGEVMFILDKVSEKMMPFMPETSKKIRDILDDLSALERVPILFPRIE